MSTTIDPSQVADRFREEIRAELQGLGTTLRLVGLLASDDGPSHTYAQYAQRACQSLGVSFELQTHSRLAVEQAIRAVNADPTVHGLMVYYPIFGNEHDAYLRDVVDPAKDVEGLHSTWARALYENRRYLDAEHTKKAILPCTPLAILKLVEAAGFFHASGTDEATGQRVLEGRTVTIFNRSEVVGRPLASMMAHDGARVYSFDVSGPLLFLPPEVTTEAHRVCETEVTRQTALAESDIVITGVPSRQFPRIRASELRDGCLCINFSTLKNFEDDATERAACFIPRVGPMTVTMVIRNALRLYRNHHQG